MTDLPSLPAWAKTLQQLGGNPRFSAAVIVNYGEAVAPAGEPGRIAARALGESA